MAKQTYWSGTPKCDFDNEHQLNGVMYDAKTIRGGQWACMCFGCWTAFAAYTDLGTGKGQKYRQQDDGKWLKVEG